MPPNAGKWYAKRQFIVMQKTGAQNREAGEGNYALASYQYKTMRRGRKGVIEQSENKPKHRYGTILREREQWLWRCFADKPNHPKKETFLFFYQRIYTKP